MTDARMQLRIGIIESQDHLTIQIGGFRFSDPEDPRLSMPFELVPDLDWISSPLHMNFVGNLIGMLMEYLPDLAYHAQVEIERKIGLN